MAAAAATTEAPRQVQELADGGAAPPSRYVVVEEADRPIGPDGGAASTQAQSLIPVVDLRRLTGPEGAEEAARLGSALRSWGLFQVAGHRMSDDFLDEVRDIAWKFFKLPAEEKRRFSNIKGTVFLVEGYGNDPVVTEEQTLDWNDRLYLLVKPEEARKLDRWPDNPSSFRDILHEFAVETWNVAGHVLRGIAISLELDEDDCFVAQFDDKAMTCARFNYYPRCSRPELVFGLKPHCDSSAITVTLLDKHTPGLQTLKDGEWVGVSTLPNALLVNLGDQMEIMTNGIYKSPVHRVVTNPERSRISIVTFHDVGHEREIGPADGLMSETRPRMYRDVKVRDYLDVFLQKFFGGERGIDWAKV